MDDSWANKVAIVKMSRRNNDIVNSFNARNMHNDWTLVS